MKVLKKITTNKTRKFVHIESYEDERVIIHEIIDEIRRKQGDRPLSKEKPTSEQEEAIKKNICMIEHAGNIIGRNPEN